MTFGPHARIASPLYLSLSLRFFVFNIFSNYDIDDASGSEDQPLIRLIFAAWGVAHLLTCADRLMSDSDDGDNEPPPPLETDDEDVEDDASVAHNSKCDIESDDDEYAPSLPIFLKRRPAASPLRKPAGCGRPPRVTGIRAETTGATGAAVAGIDRLPKTKKTLEKNSKPQKQPRVSVGARGPKYGSRNP